MNAEEVVNAFNVWIDQIENDWDSEDKEAYFNVSITYTGFGVDVELSG